MLMHFICCLGFILIHLILNTRLHTVKAILVNNSLLNHFRFAPTRAPAPWDDVKQVDQIGPVCPQRLPDISNETLALDRMPKGRLEYLRRLLPRLKNQSEDCLYMNIYTPVQG